MPLNRRPPCAAPIAGRTGSPRCVPLTAGLLLSAMLVPAPALAQEPVPEPLDRRGPIGTTPMQSPRDPVVQRTNRPGDDLQLTATAEVVGGDGARLGTVAFVETPSGLLIQGRLENLPPGEHAFHIHETGSCEPPDFKSAGGHFNPTGASHGFLDPNGPHAGDLPNVFVGEDGVLRVDVLTDRLQIEPGMTSLLPSGSRAVVLHAGLDDYRTDPAGKAGDRIACGVILSPIAEAAPERADLPGSGE